MRTSLVGNLAQTTPIHTLDLQIEVVSQDIRWSERISECRETQPKARALFGDVERPKTDAAVPFVTGDLCGRFEQDGSVASLQMHQLREHLMKRTSSAPAWLVAVAERLTATEKAAVLEADGPKMFREIVRLRLELEAAKRRPPAFPAQSRLKDEAFRSFCRLATCAASMDDATGRDLTQIRGDLLRELVVDTSQAHQMTGAIRLRRAIEDFVVASHGSSMWQFIARKTVDVLGAYQAKGEPPAAALIDTTCLVLGLTRARLLDTLVEDAQATPTCDLR